MQKCQICKISVDNGSRLCSICTIALNHIDYLFSNPENEKKVLIEFSWLFARYPRFWRYFNVFCDILENFVFDQTRISLSKDEIFRLHKKTKDQSLVIDILINGGFIQRRQNDEFNFEKGEILDNLIRIVIRAVNFEEKDYRKEMQYVFGFLSIILVRALVYSAIDNTLNEDYEEHRPKLPKLIPRKAMAIFKLFARHVGCFDDTEDIDPKISENTFQDAFHKLNKIQKRKTIQEMSGFTFVSPGKPKIISDSRNNELHLKEEMVEYLSRFREYNRNREHLL